ncbi:retrovirus-related pol polyprotein from transposon TNT 1-94 [Tanacetum coccineum]
MAVPISTKEPKYNVNQSIETISKKTVTTDSTVKKSRHITRKLYEQVSKTCSWWYPKYTPPGYNWKPKSQIGNVNPNVSMPLGNASRTANILEHKTPRCSTMSNTPLSSNSFAAHLEVAFRKSTCYICDLKGNDLLTGSRGTDLYSITLQDSSTPNPICLMAKATSSQAWLWHRRLSYLNFDTINLLSKKNIVNGLPKLKFVKDHLCMKFLNKTLHAYIAKEGIRHETSIDRTPEQNGVVERRNRTLVEAARTILGAAKVPLFFWAEAIATACFTQNHSLVIPRHEKTPYHIINAQKLSVKFFHIFGSLCYIVRDGENLDKMKEKVFRLHAVLIIPITRQQHNTTHSSTITDVADAPPLNIQSTHQTPTQVPTVTAPENIIQAETNTENAQFDDDEFINIFSTPVQE